jgi:hypothetical protein
MPLERKLDRYDSSLEDLAEMCRWEEMIFHLWIVCCISLCLYGKGVRAWRARLLIGAGTHTRLNPRLTQSTSTLKWAQTEDSTKKIALSNLKTGYKHYAEPTTHRCICHGEFGAHT